MIDDCGRSDECQLRGLLEPDSVRSAFAVWRHLTHNRLLRSSSLCAPATGTAHQSRRPGDEDGTAEDRRRTAQCQTHSVRGQSFSGERLSLNKTVKCSASQQRYSLCQRWTWVGSIHGLGWVEILANSLIWVGLNRLNHVNFISVIAVAIVTVIVRSDRFVTVCRQHTSYYKRYTIWVGFVFSNLLHLIEICRLGRDYCGVVGLSLIHISEPTRPY